MSALGTAALALAARGMRAADIRTDAGTIDAFRARCAADAHGSLNLPDAVDHSQQYAEAFGLVLAIGQNAVQAIMAEAFAEHPRDRVLDPLPDSERRGVARSTLDAAAYLIRENDAKRFETWLLRHSPADRVGIIAYLDKCRGPS